VTPAEIKALWRESNIHQLDDFEGLYKFVQRVLGIGRAEAFEEAVSWMVARRNVLVPRATPVEWLRARAAEERERAKS